MQVGEINARFDSMRKEVLQMGGKDYKTLLKVLSIILEVYVVLDASKESQEGKPSGLDLKLLGDSLHID